MASRIERAHAKKLKDGVLKPDPGQDAALKALARLEKDLGRRGLFGGMPQVRGVYLYGPPGRGKSMLMDLFFAQVQEPRKRRAHFHAFLSRVHGLIRSWREGDKRARKATFGQWKGDDPIGPVAALIASEARLLCFDELQVTDIADALILGRLFQALFEHKVVLAITSNRRPQDLYLNGVNRELFVPFIDLIEARCERVEVAGSRDWRIDALASAPAWYDSTDADGRAGFDALWQRLRGDEPEAEAALDVLGREIWLPRTVGGMARATFADLCQRALGPNDYLALADRFHTLFLEEVPVLRPDDHAAARRLVTLIDALYEAKTRLVVLAAAPAERLYPEGQETFEFGRTVSRLKEMTGKGWLAATGSPPSPTMNDPKLQGRD